MSKFVLKGKPDEEIKLGDTMTIRFKTQFGTVESVRTIDEKYLKDLINGGIVIEVEDSTEKESEMNIFHVISHLAKRVGWKPENLKKYIENLYTISPVAVYQTLLKEVALMIDSHHSGHISESRRLFAVSIIDGEIFELKHTDCGNYANIALFRTYKEAELAKKVLMLIEADIF